MPVAPDERGSQIKQRITMATTQQTPTMRLDTSIQKSVRVNSPVVRESRFNNKVSGSMFTGTTMEDYFSFANDKMTHVIIQETKKKMSWRIIVALLGEKFVIAPRELKNIHNIIKAHFIRSNKLVRSQARTKKICGELADLSFDVDFLFDSLHVTAQAAGGSISTGTTVPHAIFLIIKYLNYQAVTGTDFATRLHRWLSNVNPYSRLTVSLWDLGDLSVLRSCLFFAVAERELLTDLQQIKVKDLNTMLTYMSLSSGNTDTHGSVHAQSGTLGKLGIAHHNPAVAQSWFDLSVSNTHGLDENSRKLFSGLTQVMTSMNENVAKTSSLKDMFNNLISCITGGVKVRFDGLDELLARIDICFDGVKRAVCVMLIYVVFRLLKLSNLFNDTVLAVIGAVLTVFGVSELFGREIWVSIYERISAFTTLSDMVTIEADYGSLSEPIEAFLAMMQVSILGKAWMYEKDMIKAFKSSIGGWSKLKVDLADSISTWFGLFQDFCDWICTITDKSPWKLWTGKHPELSAYVESVNTFLDSVSKDPTLTFEKGRRLEQILKEGRQVLQSLPVSAIHERNLHRSVTESMSSWKTKLGKANFLGSGPRVKPLGIMFTGPSQVGKSEMNNVFCRLVAARCLPIERLESFVLNPSTEVYNRIIEQEFWDAWSDQSIIQIDEIGARKDVAGQNNEAFEAIRLINGNNFSLHAADIESKGMINARPILVSATSNNIMFDWNSITFPEAFDNRFEAYACVPRNEFLSSECDIFSFKDVKMKNLDEWFFKFEHLALHRYDLSIARRTGSIQAALIGEPINFEMLVELTVEKIQKAQIKGQNILKMHDQIIKSELMKRNDAEKIEKIYTSTEEEMVRYRASVDKLNHVVAQGFTSNDAKNLMSTLYLAISAAYMAIGPSVIEAWSKTLPDKIMGGAVTCVASGYKFIRSSKETIAQADILVKESIKEVVGCGSCIVCKHRLVTPWDIMEDDALWPEGSEFIKINYKDHDRISVFDRELAIASHVVTPYCLKLKRDVWDAPHNTFVRFADAEAYSFLIAGLLDRTLARAADGQKLSLKMKCEEYFRLSQTCLAKFASEWKVIAPVAAALSACAVMVYNFAMKVLPQSSSGISGKRKPGRVRRTKVTRITKLSTLTESATDGIIDNVMNKVLARNQYRIGSTGQPPMGLVTMLGHNIGFMPMHFAEILTDFNTNNGSEVWLLPALIGNLEQKVEVPFSAFEFYEPDAVENSCDLIYFTIDVRYLAPCPSIVKYFVAEEKLPNEKFYGALYAPRIVGSNLILTKEPGWVVPNTTISYADAGDTLEPFNLTDAYQYHFKTDRGDCGSLLVRYSPDGTPQRILGLHVSGSRYGVGYGQPMILENVQNMFDFIKKKGKVTKIHVDDYDFPSDGLTVVQGFVNLGPVKGPRAPEETKIVPSPLNNVAFPCCTAPVQLAIGYVDGIHQNPMEESRKPYLVPSILIPQELLDQCTWSLIKTLSNKSVVNEHTVGRRLLTFEEACFGIEGHEFLNGMKSSTSAGFPLCMEYNPFPGTKRKWLGPTAEGERIPHDDENFVLLKEAVEGLLSLASGGTRTINIFTDFNKDERRKFGKGARLVSGSSLKYLIACTMHFSALSEWLMSNRVLNGMCIGINPFCDEWNTLAQSLNMKGSNVDSRMWMDGDFKAFDGSHSRQLMYTFKSLCDWFYGNESLVRDVLLEDLFNSLHIHRGRVYIWSKSLPSGSFFTSLINCWNNLLLHRIAACKSFTRVKALPLNVMTTNLAIHEYEQYVRTQVYGDDNMHWVDYPAQGWFNMGNHIQSMSELGYIYTDALKKGGVTTFLLWTEVSFLKRKFRKHDILKTIVAPLSLETICDMIQWTKKQDSLYEDCKKTIQTALKELSFHQKEVFDFYSDKIVSACNHCMYWAPETISYEVLSLLNSGRKEYL